MTKLETRHCEARSNEAIQTWHDNWIATPASRPSRNDIFSSVITPGQTEPSS
ncbi:MAG: hypothetical protein V7788_13490 [Alphaproteobacteria bacterium]